MTTKSLTLIPFPTNNQLTTTTPPPSPPPPPKPTNNLDQEITTMRGAMTLLTGKIHDNLTLAELAFYSATLSRLADSITRALLAAQKLNTIDKETAERRAEIQRLFHELGWTKQP